MKLLKFIGQNAVINFITYTIMGMLAASILGYEEIWKDTLVDLGNYRAFDSRWVMLGPVLQPLRGAVYGLILWPFKETITKSKFGWLKLFGLFWGIGIFGTFAAAIGSFEGIIYTNYSLKLHLFGQPEITGHALLYSFLLYKLADESQNNVKTGIKAVGIAFLSKVVYIILGLVNAGITGSGGPSDNVAPGIYISLFASAVILIILVFIFIKKDIGKLKMLLIYTAGIAVPYLIYSFAVGPSLLGVLFVLFSSALASLIAMLLTVKLR